MQVLRMLTLRSTTAPGWWPSGTSCFLRMQVLQLQEVLAVRHGVMVVGLPLAGKSAVLATLAAALSALAAADPTPGQPFERVDVVTINPKALTMGELYGANDRATQEWRVRCPPSGSVHANRYYVHNGSLITDVLC